MPLSNPPAPVPAARNEPVSPAEPAPAAPVPASPVPASPVPASPVPASPVPAGSAPAASVSPAPALAGPVPVEPPAVPAAAVETAGPAVPDAPLPAVPPSATPPPPAPVAPPAQPAQPAPPPATPSSAEPMTVRMQTLPPGVRDSLAPPRAFPPGPREATSATTPPSETPPAGLPSVGMPPASMPPGDFTQDWTARDDAPHGQEPSWQPSHDAMSFAGPTVTHPVLPDDPYGASTGGWAGNEPADTPTWTPARTPQPDQRRSDIPPPQPPAWTSNRAESLGTAREGRAPQLPATGRSGPAPGLYGEPAVASTAGPPAGVRVERRPAGPRPGDREPASHATGGSRARPEHGRVLPACHRPVRRPG